MTCENCEGKGYLITRGFDGAVCEAEKCWQCNGNGTITEEE